MEEKGESVSESDGESAFEDKQGKNVYSVELSSSNFNKDTLSPEDFKIGTVNIHKVAKLKRSPRKQNVHLDQCQQHFRTTFSTETIRGNDWNAGADGSQR